MKKCVGILSTFCNNYNYGGKLQAYALVKAVERAGETAKQIQYYQRTAKGTSGLSQKLLRMMTVSDYRRAAVQKMLGKVLPDAKKAIGLRKQAFDGFDKEIPHTDVVYSDATIGETVDDFDAFICGSDQIWNPQLSRPAYFLGFASGKKYRFSYSASIAGKVTDQWKENFRKLLSDFNGVSVRERDARSMLSDVLEQPVEVSLDPTLLLRREDWEVISSPPVVDTPYLFCYFLGYSSKIRRDAEKFARRYGLKIVTLPHLLGTAGRFYSCDIHFGDIRLYEVSPAQFLSLIQNASYIMTDSFHATVMSLTFEKQFVVFDRIGFPGMVSRIEDLLSLYGLEKRCLACTASVQEIYRILDDSIQYQEHYPLLEEMREQSWEYLKENLLRAENYEV